MANKFHFEMITADGKKTEDEVELLNVVTSSGAIGVMHSHTPLIAILVISHVRYKKDGKEFFYAISGGIINVQKDKTTILADSFESKDEIDIERAKKAKERAEKRLQTTDKDIDYKRAEIALKKAINRLDL